MIAKLTKNDFDGIFELIEKSFPTDEYRQKSGQRALFSLPEYEVWGIKKRRKRIANGRLYKPLAIWMDLPTASILPFAESFAGRGREQKFWQRFCKTSTKDFALRRSCPKRKPQSAELHFMSETDLP